jgi:hypothetical protein
MPLIDEALECRMHAFTMSSRSVRRKDLGAIYKLSRFVGHGVLYSAGEAAKRLNISPALAKSFTTPVDIKALDPTGTFVQELCGTRESVKKQIL